MTSIKLKQLEKEIKDKEQLIKDLINQNKEENTAHERQMREFRNQKNQVIDLLKNNLG